MATPTRVACWLKACACACAAAASVAGTLVMSACIVPEEVEASGQVLVAHEPPPDRAEEPGAPPGAEYVWIRGRWLYGGSGWSWRGGHWEVRRPGHQWVSGHWAQQRGGWLWIEGRWQRQ